MTHETQQHVHELALRRAEVDWFEMHAEDQRGLIAKPDSSYVLCAGLLHVAEQVRDMREILSLILEHLERSAPGENSE